MTREDFDIVRHTKIAHFGMHLGLAGLAVAWQVAASLLPSVSERVYQVLALVSAVLFVIWLALYALRALKYPQKVSEPEALVQDQAGHAVGTAAGSLRCAVPCHKQHLCTVV